MPIKIDDPELLEDSKAYFDYLASIYPEDSHILLYRQLGLRRAKNVAEALLPHVREEQERFLEIGCADGSLPIVMSRLGFRSAGVDIHTDSLRLAETRATDVGQSVCWTSASVYDLPYPDSAFDVIACNDLLEHLEDVPRGLREVSRILSPDGVLYINVTSRFSILNILVEPHTHLFGVILLPQPVAEKIVKRVKKTSFPVYSPMGYGRFLRILRQEGFTPVAYPAPGLVEKVDDPGLILNTAARVGTRALRAVGMGGFLRRLFKTRLYLSLISPTHHCIVHKTAVDSPEPVERPPKSLART